MHHAEGGHSRHDTVVICSGLSADDLLEPLGHSRPMGPVLGQAVTLALSQGPTNWAAWPAVLVDQGFNLIPDGPGRCGWGQRWSLAAKRPQTRSL